MDELRSYNLNALKLIHEISNILKEYPEIVKKKEIVYLLN